MTWTVFTDLKSGGTLKSKYQAIAIELPRSKAMTCFENTLHFDPIQKSCPCCSLDFHVATYPNIEQATGAFRDAKYANGQYTNEPVKGRVLVSVDYLRSSETMLIIGLADIDVKHNVSYIIEDEYDD